MSNDDWNKAFPEAPRSFHETVRNTLDTQLTDRIGGVKSMKKRFPLVLAAVVAALGVTAAVAAYVTDWNGKLAAHFGADEQQQSQLAADGAVGSVNQAVTANGVTVTALQTLGDKNGIYILFDVKAPESVALSDSNLFKGTAVNIEGASAHASWSGGFMSNADKTASLSGKANERYYELWLNNSEKEDWNGKTITVEFTDLQADKGKLDMYNVAEGNWKLTWPLSYMDKTRTFAVNRSYTINGQAVLVKSVELSPLSMTLNLGGDGLKQLIDDSDLKECGGLLTCSLKLKDGTSFEDFDGSRHENPGEILPGSVKWTDSSYTRVSPFGKILNMDEVSSLTLTFPSEKADNTLTIALA